MRVRVSANIMEAPLTMSEPVDLLAGIRVQCKVVRLGDDPVVVTSPKRFAGATRELGLLTRNIVPATDDQVKRIPRKMGSLEGFFRDVPVGTQVRYKLAGPNRLTVLLPGPGGRGGWEETVTVALLEDDSTRLPTLYNMNTKPWTKLG